MIGNEELDKLIKKALKILRKNYSCPGEDGISYRSIKTEPTLHFTHIKEMFFKIVNGSGQFSTPRGLKIIDAHKKERIIYVYNIYDRVIQQCVKLLIASSVKAKISEKVLSHRKGVDLNKKIKELLYTSESIELVLRLDIENYYSTINKEILFRMLLNIGISDACISFIRASFLHCENGIPAGNCLSPILSDFYLTPIDSLYEVSYARFSDDMFFALKRLESVDSFIDNITPALVKLELKMNKSKVQLIINKNIETIL